VYSPSAVKNMSELECNVNVSSTSWRGKSLCCQETRKYGPAGADWWSRAACVSSRPNFSGSLLKTLLNMQRNSVGYFICSSSVLACIDFDVSFNIFVFEEHCKS